MFLPFFFFNDTATTEIYTLSLHDALPILISTTPFRRSPLFPKCSSARSQICPYNRAKTSKDRKSTRLNSSHANISYAVFCLKKKKKKHHINPNKNNPKLQIYTLHISNRET